MVNGWLFVIYVGLFVFLLSPLAVFAQYVTPQKITPQNITPQNITPQNITPQNMTPILTPEQARKFISAPRPVFISPSSPVKISMVSEATVKSVIEKKIKNKELFKGSMSVRTTADAKDNVSFVPKDKQQKVANGKNKLNCKKTSRNFKCSFSDKETVVAQDPVNPLIEIPPSAPLNIDGRNIPPPPSPYK